MKYVRPMHPILSNVQATNRTSNVGNAGLWGDQLKQYLLNLKYQQLQPLS